jgi:hypothetical protein
VLGGQTCEGLGYYGGQLACGADCTFDRTACAVVGGCGDGVLHEAFGEVCDGAALGGESCISLGYHGGQLACHDDCGGYDLTFASRRALWGWCAAGGQQLCDGTTCLRAIPV